MKGIYGYYFVIEVEEGELGYVAHAPGVGGVYEEGTTPDDAAANAYEAACAILKARMEHYDPITEENACLRILTTPPTPQSITSIENVPHGYIVTLH